MTLEDSYARLHTLEMCLEVSPNQSTPSRLRYPLSFSFFIHGEKIVDNVTLGLGRAIGVGGGGRDEHILRKKILIQILNFVA